MLKKLIPILFIISILPLSSCAWENLPEGEVPTQKIIEVSMRLGGTMHEDLFYYIVFNLSGDPEKKPFSVFEDPDRGKYWTVYYMYGKPPYKERDLYRGFGGLGTSGNKLIDNFPERQEFLNELLPGTTVQGDQMKLRLDLTELPLASDVVNVNMIVCNQAIDAESKFEYEYDPYVFDSFYQRGISVNLGSTLYFWDEAHDPLEEIANEHEESAPPEADIINWRIQVISW